MGRTHKNPKVKRWGFERRGSGGLLSEVVAIFSTHAAWGLGIIGIIGILGVIGIIGTLGFIGIRDYKDYRDYKDSRFSAPMLPDTSTTMITSLGPVEPEAYHGRKRGS